MTGGCGPVRLATANWVHNNVRFQEFAQVRVQIGEDVRGLLPRVATALALLACGVAPARAQLRPLDAVQWEAFLQGRVVMAELGVGTESGQHLQLAGTEGRLTEWGNFRLLWRSGRVTLEGSGTMVRRFVDQSVYADTTGGAFPPTGEPRVDAGDFRVETAVRLTPERWPFLGTLRFGTRLPTTNNRKGIGRDQTDFFALAGLAYHRGGFLAGVENGVSINGTRLSFFEQSDEWAYAAHLQYRWHALTSVVELLGQEDGLKYRVIRGNLPLGEVRLGARFGGRRWVRLEWLKGYRPSSPSSGVLISAGAWFGPRR